MCEQLQIPSSGSYSALVLERTYYNTFRNKLRIAHSGRHCLKAAAEAIQRETKARTERNGSNFRSPLGASVRSNSPLSTNFAYLQSSTSMSRCQLSVRYLSSGRRVSLSERNEEKKVVSRTNTHVRRKAFSRL